MGVPVDASTTYRTEMSRLSGREFTTSLTTTLDSPPTDPIGCSETSTRPPPETSGATELSWRHSRTNAISAAATSKRDVIRELELIVLDLALPFGQPDVFVNRTHHRYEQRSSDTQT